MKSKTKLHRDPRAPRGLFNLNVQIEGAMGLGRMARDPGNYLITCRGGGCGFITWMFGRIPIREGGRPKITPPGGLFEGGLSE